MQGVKDVFLGGATYSTCDSPNAVVDKNSRSRRAIAARSLMDDRLSKMVVKISVVGGQL